MGKSPLLLNVYILMCMRTELRITIVCRQYNLPGKSFRHDRPVWQMECTEFALVSKCYVQLKILTCIENPVLKNFFFQNES